MQLAIISIMENTMRLDKYLANLGICSRRNIKQLLKARIVTVNGDRVRESGVRINPVKDDIQLDGERLKQSTLVYYLVNKPEGIVSTTSDELGRRDVTHLVPSKTRIYPIGRLDKDTTALIILTNDGELTHQLTHPKYHVPKIYRLTIEGRATNNQLMAFRKGIILEDGITSPAPTTVIKDNILEVTLHEGRNRQIRRMCEEVGIKLLALQRIAFGPIKMGALKEGDYRELTQQEIEQLRAAANMK